MELSLKPESVSTAGVRDYRWPRLRVLGLQAISRQLGSADEDRAVLRALGAVPAVTAADGLIGVLAAVVLGSLLAGAVAIGLSPLAPHRTGASGVLGSGDRCGNWGVLETADLRSWSSASGPPRPRCPHGGQPTWRPVANGVRPAIPRVSRQHGNGGPAGGWRSRGAVRARAGQGRTAVPVRSALFGAVLAVVIVVATLTFGAGLHTLVRTPLSTGGTGPTPSTRPTGPATSPRPARPRPGRGGVDRVRLHRRPDRRPDRPYHRQPRRQGLPTGPVGSRARRQGSDRARARPRWPACTSTSATPSPQLRKAKDAPVYIPPTRLVIVGTATLPAVGSTASSRNTPRWAPAPSSRPGSSHRRCNGLYGARTRT